jgi:hypothetical protein
METDLVSKEHDEAQELDFLPETVEPIVHCALERCPGGESNHFPQLRDLSSNFSSQLC